MILRLPLRFSLAIGLIGLCSAVHGQGLLLDIQNVGGTTAAGYQAFEAENQVLPTAATNYAAGTTGFTNDVSVLFGVANLPDGNLDFRALPRDGAAGEVVNDWVGVDTRAAGVDVTLSMTFSGLAAGTYNWRSYHTDGGTGTTNGNLNGTMDYSLGNAGASLIPDGITVFQGNTGGTPSSGDGILDSTFTSDGSDVVFTMIMDNGQGGTNNALFAFANGVEITTSAVPEPGSLGLIALGLVGLVARRRRS